MASPRRAAIRSLRRRRRAQPGVRVLRRQSALRRVQRGVLALVGFRVQGSAFGVLVRGSRVLGPGAGQAGEPKQARTQTQPQTETQNQNQNAERRTLNPEPTLRVGIAKTGGSYTVATMR